MTTSVNGWPLVPSGSPQLSTMPGVPTAPVALTGPVATLLGYVAAQFHSQVEAITSTSSHRPGARISGTSLYSNHASATAIDLNGQLHPQYRRGTFTATQVAKIRTILAATTVVDWGGDWNDTAVDEMHFEIRPGTTTQQAADAADALTREETDMTPAQAAKLDEVHWMLSTVRNQDLPGIRSQTDRLPTIHAGIDLLRSGVTNVTNGVKTILEKLG